MTGRERVGRKDEGNGMKRRLGRVNREDQQEAASGGKELSRRIGLGRRDGRERMTRASRQRRNER